MDISIGEHSGYLLRQERSEWWLPDLARRPGFGWGNWAREPEVARTAYGVRSGMDRLICLGNAVVPQIAEWIGRRIMESVEHEPR
jgi:hypothetical protein